jgi:predicted transcriptional regulator
MKATKQYTNPSDITEALKNLGLKSKEAAVLTFLMKNQDEPVSQWDIEWALQLRQPYVSAALRTLEHHNWVDVSMKLKDAGTMGRPENIYRLKVSPVKIAKDLKDDYINRQDVLKKSIRTIQASG